MKLHDIVLHILNEQVDEPQDGEQVVNPEDVQQEPETDDSQEPETDVEPQSPVKPKKEKVLSPIEKTKIKWLSENPHLNDTLMDAAIEFFNSRKNNLRAFMPNPGPNVRNMPEIYALKQRFPEFGRAIFLNFLGLIN